MPVTIATTYTPGATVFFTARRQSDGFWWDQTNTQFAASPADDDKKMAATPLTGQLNGRYEFTQTAWTDVNRLELYAHEDLGAGGYLTLGQEVIVVSGGDEFTDRDMLDQIYADTQAILAIVSPSVLSSSVISSERTWRGESGDSVARNIVTLTPEGAVPVKVAMDFSDMLQDTSILSVSNTSKSGSFSLTNAQPNGNGTQVHFDLANLDPGLSATVTVWIVTRDADTLSLTGELRVV